MGYKNGNYSAFYVSEPFSESSLGAYAAKDFQYYNLLRAWKGRDSSFLFNDSHNKTYNVRDGSDWEKTLKPRLRERLNCSKNIILFLSSVTKNSKALREEIDYGINTLGLPVIVIYPELKDKSSLLTSTGKALNSTVEALWNNLPIFRDSKSVVPVLHIPLNKELIEQALNDPDLMINSKCDPGDYFFNKLNMKKVTLFDKRILTKFWGYFSIISGIISFVYLFNFFPDACEKCNLWVGLLCLILLVFIYLSIWICVNKLKNVKIQIDGSSVIIKEGDLFEEEGYKAIGFNEYFDTQVDNRIISEHSLNGIFINTICANKTKELDKYITEQCDDDDIIEKGVNRKNGGKAIKYKLSTIIVYKEYLLTAFSKFDDKNRAYLTMPEYVEFLINFWDRVNRIYAQKSVSVPIFGSGITRIKEHKNITDEDLLKIMLWTFKLSEYRFKYPAKLTIIIHKDKIDEINLLDIESMGKGL